MSNNLTQLYTSDGNLIEPMISLKTVADVPLFGTGNIDVESEKYTTWFVFFITEVDPSTNTYITPTTPLGGKKSLDSNNVLYPDIYPTSTIIGADGNNKTVSWRSEAEANANAGKENYKIFYSYATLCHKPGDGNYYILQNGESWSTPIEYALGTIGKDGEGIEYMYYRSKTQQPNLDAPNENWPYDVFVNGDDAQKLDANNSGWCDDPQGVSFEYPYEYVSIRTGSGEPANWSGCPWSTPSLWSKYGEDGRDGEGLEYIYFLSNSADAPIFDESTNTEDPRYKGFSIDAQQTPEYLPFTNEIKWTDDYVKPSDLLRYSWVSTRRYKDTGVKDEKGKPIFKWTLFNTPKLWNVFMQSGKAYAELYRRSTAPLSIDNAPEYTGDIYYWFDTDRYTSDLAGTEQLIEIGKEDNLWHDDYVEDGGSYLYMCEALVDIESIDKPVRISDDKWKNVKLISKDGESALTIFIDLSNDMDQIYVNDEFKTPCKQVFVTTPAVFDGIEHKKDASLSWTLKCINAVTNELVDVSSSGDKYITADKVFEYSIPEDTSIDGDYIFTFTYNVSNDTTGGESGTNTTTGSVSNTFKLKRIQGTHDYDLWSSVTYIKKDASNNYNCSDTSIYITSRSVNSKVGEITKLDTVPADCSVVYIDKDSSSNEVKNTITEGNILTKFKFEKTDYTKSVELYRGGVLVDVIYIDVIKDGEKGDPGESAMFIDLSNEMDQIYVSDTGQLPVKQTFSTVPRIFRGSKEQPTGTISYKITYDDDNSIDGLSDDKATGSIDTGKTFSCEFDTSIKIVRNIKCVFTDVSSGASSTFSIKRLQGLTDYDLYSNCTVVVQDTNGNNTPNTIEVGITAKSILTPEKYAKRPTTLPSNCKIKYNGVECEPEEGNILSLPIKVPVPVNDDTTKYFELYNDEELIDQITIEVLKDGSQGAPGESAIHIDLSNDMDQVYVNEQYNTEVKQTFTTIPVVFKGLNKQPVDVSYKITYDDDSSISASSLDIEDTGTITYGNRFKCEFDASVEIAKNIKCVFTYGGASSTFVIKRIQGTHDYDLWSDVTYIKKDANEGFSPNDASIKITSRPVNLNGGIVEYLTEVPTDCSVVYIDKDNNGNEITKEFPNKEDGNKLKNFAFKKNDYTKYVELRRNGELVDKIVIDILKDGKDGNSSYFIDLSNDVDQVYVNANGITDVAQTFTTIPMVFNGTNPITDADVSCGIKNVNGTITHIRDISVGTEFKYDVSAGAEITDDIHVVFTYKGVSSSTFIIKRIQGTYDYDLWSDITYVKRDALKNVKPNSALVKITGKAVNSKIGTIEYLDTVPDGCSVTYINTKSKNGNATFEDGDTLTPFIFNDDSNTKSVELYDENGTLVNKIDIEVADNTKSPLYINLRDEINCIYVDSSGHPIVDQTFELDPELYYGQKEIQNYNYIEYYYNNEFKTWTCDSAHNPIVFAYNTSSEIKDDIVVPFWRDDYGHSAYNTFTIKRVVVDESEDNVYDYKLFADILGPIKKDGDLKAALIKISERIIKSKDANASDKANFIGVVPTDCSVRYIDGNNVKEFTTHASLEEFAFDNTTDDPKIIELYRNGELIHKIVLSVLDYCDKSILHIEPSNEMLQVFVNENHITQYDQVFTITPILFNGVNELSNASIEYTIPKPGDTTIKGNVISGKPISLNLKKGLLIIDAIKCQLNYESLSKGFDIVPIEIKNDQKYSYNLCSDVTYIKKDANGNINNEKATIQIIETPIIASDGDSNYLPTVPANCSVIYKTIKNDNTEGTIEKEYGPGEEIQPFEFNGNDDPKIVELYINGVLADKISIDTLEPIKEMAQIDLSYDMDRIYVDTDGNVIADQYFKISPTLYHGDASIAGELISYEFSIAPNRGATIFGNTSTGGYMHFGWERNFYPKPKIDNDIAITFTDPDNPNVCKKFEIKRIVADKMPEQLYRLSSDVTSIKKGNVASANNIKISNTTNFNEELSIVPKGYTVKYVNGIDDTTVTYNANEKLPKFELSNNNDVKIIEMHRGGVLVDRINIDVLNDGKDGESPYFIDLSNDMDQLYIDSSRYPIVKQTFTCIPTVYYGSKIISDAVFDVSLYYSPGAGHEMITLESTTCNSGSQYKLTFNTTNHVISNVHLTFTYDNKVSKTFIIKTLEGNHDYDLWSDVTYIRADASGKIISPKDASVKIVSKSVSVKNEVSKYLTVVPVDCSVRYKDGSSDKTYKTGQSLQTFTFANNTNTKYIELYRSGVLVDKINIEVVKDGEPGANGSNGAPGESASFIDLSNDMDQIYVNADNYPIKAQTFSTTPRFFVGTTLDKNAVINYTITYDNGKAISDADFAASGAITSGNEVKFTIKPSVKIEDNIKCVFTNSSSGVSSTFTIKMLHGNIDYDLYSNCSVIIKDASGGYNPSAIDISIKSRNLQTLESTELYCTTVPAGYCIKYNDVSVKVAGDALPYSITVNDVSTKIIKLYRDNVLVDQMNIEVLKDGEKGDPGESPYFIDLSNDMDQIYIDGNRYPIEDQTITCTPTLYRGIEKVKDASIYYRIGNNNLQSISNGSTCTIEYLKKDQLPSTDDIHVTFVDTSIFENRTASKTFTIKPMIGDHDYDLWSNVTYIRTDASCTTINPTDASVKIVSRPVNSKNGKIEYLTEVPTGCYVKYKDGSSETNYTSGVLPDFTFANNTDTKYIELYRGGVLADRINIEVVKDGEPGADGSPGAPGVAGPIIYPAGVWTIGKKYKADADASGNLTRIPYVEYENAGNLDSSYYICISTSDDGADTTKTPAENSTDWQPMAQFDSVFTKLLVAKNGTIGKAVYSGDYMFSQHGKIGNSNSSDYKEFDVNVANKGGINAILNSSAFVPNICLDFNSGAGYFNRGSIKFDASGLVIGSDVSIKADLTIGDFVVNKFIFEPNKKFVYANNGSWGYENYEDGTVTSLRAISTNADDITVSLWKYSLTANNNYKVLEGRIIGKPYAKVKFKDKDATQTKLDGYGVLDYVAICDASRGYNDGYWTLKLLNQFASSDYAKIAYTIDVTVENLPSYTEKIKYCNLELLNGNFPLPDPFGTTQTGKLNGTTTCTWNFDKNKYTLLKPTVAYITFTTIEDKSYTITIQNDSGPIWQESVDAPQYNSNLNYNISNCKLTLYPPETDWQVC